MYLQPCHGEIKLIKRVDRALFAILKLSQLTAAILFPASRPYSLHCRYPSTKNL